MIGDVFVMYRPLKRTERMSTVSFAAVRGTEREIFGTDHHAHAGIFGKARIDAGKSFAEKTHFEIPVPSLRRGYCSAPMKSAT